ncbi:MAG: TetR/AcrR family transcriptional regulator [Alphaproteobacteria bacterium]|nr:TetR/AcrR family transcriptional regulator [Alphaproteobacteria bacterium]
MVRKADIPDTIVEATLDLIAEKGWGRLALGDIAARAKLPVSEVWERFPSKEAVLDEWLRRLDRRMTEGGPPDLDESPRDRLFEVMMRRFDALQPRREAVRRLLRDGPGDLRLLYSRATAWPRTLALMLETAGISTSGASGLLRVEGLAGIHLAVLRTWLRDDTADMARTMAELDKQLRRAETLSSILWRGSRRDERDHRPEATPHAPPAGQGAAPG